MITKIAATILLAACLAQAQDAEVRKIQDAFKAKLPSVDELRWYQLDWVPTLKDAKDRAAREKRPICLLVCINVHGNLYTGHC